MPIYFLPKFLGDQQEDLKVLQRSVGVRNMRAGDKRNVSVRAWTLACLMLFAANKLLTWLRSLFPSEWVKTTVLFGCGSIAEQSNDYAYTNAKILA